MYKIRASNLRTKYNCMYNFCVKINLKNDSNSILFRSLYYGSKNTKRTLTLEPQMIVIYTYIYVYILD